MVQTRKNKYEDLIEGHISEDPQSSQVTFWGLVFVKDENCIVSKWHSLGLFHFDR